MLVYEAPMLNHLATLWALGTNIITSKEDQQGTFILFGYYDLQRLTVQACLVVMQIYTFNGESRTYQSFTILNLSFNDKQPYM